MANNPVMDNKALKAFIDEFGDKTFFMMMTDNHRFLIGAVADTATRDITRQAPQAVYFTTKDIEYKTFGDTDMFSIPRESSNLEGITVKYHTWFVTSTIQYIQVTDELTNYLPDLYQIM